MLIQMILPTATQKVPVDISSLNWVKNAPMFAGSKICHNQSTARPCPHFDGRLLAALEFDRPVDQPTISLPEKNWAISIAAVSGASDPCTEFSPIDFACSLRMVPSAAFDGSVAPITSRYLAIAPSPSSTCTTTGPEVMKSTSSPKNGRALCTA